MRRTTTERFEYELAEVLPHTHRQLYEGEEWTIRPGEDEEGPFWTVSRPPLMEPDEFRHWQMLHGIRSEAAAQERINAERRPKT